MLQPTLLISAIFSQQEWWQIVSRLIGLGAALAILLAYEPVRWIKHRLGVASITDEAAA